MKKERFYKIIYIVIFIFIITAISTVEGSQIENAVQWLRSTQNQNGSWSIPPTDFTDTCEVANTLYYLGFMDTAYSSAITWISYKDAVNIDELSRQIEVLANSGADVTELVILLTSYQNPDGSWGVAEGFSGDCLDTCLALRALFSCNYSDSVVIGKGVNFIFSQQNDDGSFGFEAGVGDVYLTSLTLLVLKDYQLRLATGTPELSSAIDKGSTWLLSKQNSDGSFGNSIFETALCYSALIRTTFAPTQTQKALDYIQSSQLENGSWNNNAYETALALRAIYDSLHPPVPPSDLTISANDITFQRVGNQVLINALIYNTGIQNAQNVIVQFYDGNPDNGGRKINNDILISNIYGNSKAIASIVCSFSYGTHQIYVKVDPYNSIEESNETNNVAFNTYVETTENLPDLSIVSDDITFSNQNPKAGEEFTITAIVRNLGQIEANGVKVQFYDGDPEEGGKPIGEPFILSSISSYSCVSLNLKLGLDEGVHNIFVVVDEKNSIVEENEANNKAGKIISVSSGTKPDLSISSEDIIFSTYNPKAGDSIITQAVIHNTSVVDAKDIIVKFFDGDPNSGGVQINKEWYISSIPKGSTVKVEVSFSLSSGIHKIYVWVDPYNTIAEENEKNNIAYSQIVVSEGPLPDVYLHTPSITYEPAEPKAGQSVKIYIPVKNSGSVSAKGVKVRLYQGLPEAGGYSVSGDLVIQSVEPEETEIVQIGWCAGIGDHILTIVLDPENEVAEIDKINNRSIITIHVVEGPSLPPPIPEEVKAAIDKGIEFLKSQQKEDG